MVLIYELHKVIHYLLRAKFCTSVLGSYLILHFWATILYEIVFVRYPIC